MSFVRVKGCELHWEEVGQGPPLVLLHGLCDSHRTWSKVERALGRGRRVLMLDLAGHGLSERPDATYALSWHAELVGGWLDALELREIDLVGHSFGGGVALWMMLLEEHRARIRKLALVAAGGLGRDVSLSLRLASLPFVVERLGQPFMSHGTRLALNAAGGAYEAEEIARLAAMNARAGTARAFARSVRDVIDWRGQHRHVLDGWGHVAFPPVGLFWGERDKVIPIAHALEASTLFGDAPIARFPRSGHFPHRQEPARFVEALEAFLDSPARTPARTPQWGAVANGQTQQAG